MGDRFQPISMEALTDWMFDELEQKDQVFGVPRSAIFAPRLDDPFRGVKFVVIRLLALVPLGHLPHQLLLFSTFRNRRATSERAFDLSGHSRELCSLSNKDHTYCS